MIEQEAGKQKIGRREFIRRGGAAAGLYVADRTLFTPKRAWAEECFVSNTRSRAELSANEYNMFFEGAKLNHASAEYRNLFPPTPSTPPTEEKGKKKPGHLDDAYEKYILGNRGTKEEKTKDSLEANKNKGHIIFANGAFVEGTAQNFLKFVDDPKNKEFTAPGTTVYINSFGGNLIEGLLLGKIIRDKKFNTVVGRSREFGAHWRMWREPETGTHPGEIIEQGVCMSSGTFAFIGGFESRRVHLNDIFGVHQVSNQQDIGMLQAQEMTGELLKYVREMGIDSRMVEEMMKNKPETINRLTPGQMRELKIITADPLPEVSKRPIELYCKQ